MKRYLINNILAVCVAILLIVISLAFIVKRIDPNDYKDQISNLVLNQTGKTLIFQGNLEVSIFPAIALHTGPMTILDDDIFGASPFLTMEDASFHLAFWPLIKRHLEITQVSLKSPKIKLTTTSRGEKNWLKRSRSEADQHRQASGITRLEDDHRPRETLKKWTFDPVSTSWDIKDCQITWQDLGSKDEYLIDITKGTLRGNILDNANFVLQGSIADRYKTHILALHLAGAGSLQPDTAIRGTIDTLEAKLTSTATQKALLLESKCQFMIDWQNPSLLFTKITGAFNSSSFSGSVAYLGTNNLALSTDVHQAFKGDLLFPQLDLDTIIAYLDSAQSSPALEEYSTEPHKPASNKDSSSITNNLNLHTFFNHTDVELVCNIGTLNFKEAKATNVIFTANATQGNLTTKLTTLLFEGQTSGTLQINTRAKKPTFNYALALHNLQLQYATPLLQLLHQEPLIKGTLNGAITGSFQEQPNQDLLKQFNAKGHLSLTNAEYKVGPSLSFIPQKLLPSKLNFTVIKEASVQLSLANEVINAHNFIWDSPQVYITGKGQYNITNDHWDVTLLLSGSSALPSLPLHITGSFPNVNVTLNAPTSQKDFVKQIKKSVISTIQKEVAKKNRHK